MKVDNKMNPIAPGDPTYGWNRYWDKDNKYGGLGPEEYRKKVFDDLVTAGHSTEDASKLADDKYEYESSLLGNTIDFITNLIKTLKNVVLNILDVDQRTDLEKIEKARENND